MTKSEPRNVRSAVAQMPRTFVLRHSDFLRHSSFVLRPSTVLALLAVANGPLCCGCRPDGSAQKPLAVVISGDTAGWIVPCGCAAKQLGGLPRRASYVRQLRDQEEVIVADVGGAPHGTSPYDRVKFEAILDGELATEVAAHNLGAAEVALGPDYLEELARSLSAPLISANVRLADGRPLVEPLRIVETAGRRIALVGVLSPRYATDQLLIEPPREAVLEALRDAAGQFDSAIVLAYLPEGELRELAASLPEVDAVVGGPTGQPVAPELIGPTLLTSATNKGKFLARLDAPTASGERWKGSIVELGDQLADDPGQMANLKRYYARLAELDFAAGRTGLVPPLPADTPPDYRVAGSAACRKCHEQECGQWERSKHAQAWASLQKTGAQIDPYCQHCHTTGYGLPGGFVSARRSAETANVGCESCHGPAQGHVPDAKTRTTYYAQAKNHCLGCHDRENSPDFAYDTYWAQIRHGEKSR